MPSRRRLELFLASRRNIAGCVAALGGIGLLAFGITTGPVGIAVVAGMYALGFLAARPETGLRLTLFDSDDATEIRKGLERLLTSIRGRVADDVYQRVGAICYSIVQTLPGNGRAIDPTDPNINLIRQTALSYLPEALNAYLAIPRIYAERRQVQGSKTAHDILMDQLYVMDTRLHETADAIAKNDTDRLLSNVRFLQERFADSSLQLAAAKASMTSGPSDGSEGPRVV